MLDVLSVEEEEVKGEPVKLSKKQRDIIKSMKSVMAEGHTLDFWKKKYGCKTPDLVAKHLWKKANA